MSENSRHHSSPKVLGLWDGHDSGVAIVSEDKIHLALQEERLVRKKLWPHFPEQSLKLALALHPDITHIALTTADPAKLLGRIFPSLKTRYYKERRRLVPVRPSSSILKDLLTATPAIPGLGFLSEIFLSLPSLEKSWIPHHVAHAFTTIAETPDLCGRVLVLDGVGEGKSGFDGYWDTKKLTINRWFSFRESLGLIYEKFTRTLGFRELEDEGKLMALSALATTGKQLTLPLPWPRNIDAFIQKICSQNSLEQNAYLVQTWLENELGRLIRPDKNDQRIMASGGVFGNVRANGIFDDLFVSFCSGDGGLALGAAIAKIHQLTGKVPTLRNPFLGPVPPTENGEHYGFQHIGHAHPQKIAELINQGNVIGLVREAAEYGPRAFLHRSIVARPDLSQVRDELNRLRKKREFYQPFCPSFLLGFPISDERVPHERRFMTRLSTVRREYRELLRAVTGEKGSSRIHWVSKQDDPWAEDLLRECGRLFGIPGVLNTSFNLHGEPIVHSHNDAFRAAHLMGLRFLVTDSDIWQNSGE